jgi:hypothetical protein
MVSWWWSICTPRYGSRNDVARDPHVTPVHIVRVRRRLRREQDFEYYL